MKEMRLKTCKQETTIDKRREWTMKETVLETVVYSVPMSL